MAAVLGALCLFHNIFVNLLSLLEKTGACLGFVYPLLNYYVYSNSGEKKIPDWFGLCFTCIIFGTRSMKPYTP
jgi:hypothetical protein